MQSLIPEENIKGIVKNYEIPKSWKLIIGEKTMINAKKNRINDGILLPQGKNVSWSSSNRSGVIHPDNQQEDILLFQNQELTVVKTSYVRKLRMACYTDHWPVYAYLAN